VPQEIGVFVRSEAQLERAREPLNCAQAEYAGVAYGDDCGSICPLPSALSDADRLNAVYYPRYVSLVPWRLGMKVVIIGGTGLIGRKLAAKPVGRTPRRGGFAIYRG
jgi:hypothetical protein